MQAALGPWSARGLVGLFWIAAGGLGWDYLFFSTADSIESTIVAIALILICIDQGRMAWVDLDNIHQVSLSDRRVARFYGITLVTIFIELIGFYLAWQQLVLGMVVFLISQLLFNTAANIQLYPNSHEPIRPCPLQNRWPVLLANSFALSLTVLWQTHAYRQLVSILWLSMVVIYLGIKYLIGDQAIVADEIETEDR